MSHLDPSILAQYNSLVDPHLQSYFSNERIQSHLKHAGLISNQGEIIPDGEYRTRLARREHKKHVRHMLAENIVNRAIDMERARQAEMKRQFELVAKAALVNNIKESRRRSEPFSGLISSPTDMALLSVDTSWTQPRPRSVNNYHNETPQEQIRIPRVESAHIGGNYRKKSRQRLRRRSLLRSKNRSSSSTQNRRSPNRYPDSNPCQIKMVYFGPKMKIDYDHLVFEPVDEIIIMQQHCGGENIIVYKDNLKAGDQFTFDSRRHSDYPFGLTFYVKGFIDSRISTCCEYKHRRGVRLGGDRGHFAIISVKGSKPCIKCRFEKQARLKKYADSPKDKDDENKKPIIIPLPVSDQPKIEQPPVEIPVRHTSISNDNYSEDFDGSDKQKHSGRSSDSSTKHTHKKKRKSKPKEPSPDTRKAAPRKLSSTSDETPKEKSRKKTWQMIFHASNIPTRKDILLKFSFLANNGKDQTENYEINMKEFNQHLKSNKQYEFSVKLKNIGQPEQIRLKIQTTDDDDEDEEDIKWHLDHIELIDPETQSHLIFPCKQWIHLLQEKFLRISKETPRSERKRKTSSSSNNSRQLSPKVGQKPRRSSGSSSSSNISPVKFNPVRRISPETDSNRTLKSTPRNDDADQENQIHYRVTIYPSNDDDGDFYPVSNTRIFLRLNNQRKETNLTDQTCPTFSAGEEQAFELDLMQINHDKPTKLTIGYVNSDITATKWKLDKIVLRNLQTNDETVFPCKDILIRDDSNFRAEKTFEIQSNESDNESTLRNSKINSAKSDPEEKIQTSQKQQQINHFDKQKSPDKSDEDEQIEQTNGRHKQKSPDKSDEDEQIEQTNGRHKQKSPDKSDEDEQIEQTNGRHKQKSPDKSDDEEQTETPKKQETNGKIHQKTPSIQSLNVDEKQQTNGTLKEKSPSFQSMNDNEADYRKIFRQLDPKNELELGSPPQSPTLRPKTRRGRQDQSDEHYTDQPVVPPIDLNDLANQTARSNDQQNPNTLPSTTTDHREN